MQVDMEPTQPIQGDPSPRNSPRESHQIDPGVPVIYDGMDESCSICQEAFTHGDRVCRLSCRHMFHSACWERAQRTYNTSVPVPTTPLYCPNCRGAGNVIAVWNYIDPSRVTQHLGGYQVPNQLSANTSYHTIGTPPSHSSRSHSITPRTARSSESHQTATGSSPGMYYAGTFAYHMHTRLPDGRPSLLVDPGSVGNLCGDKWAKEVAIAASKSGHTPTYERRPRPLQVSGVGHGSQSCKYDCKLPVGLRPQNHHNKTSMGHLTIPAVQHSDMPGLLGKMALKNNRAVWDFVTDQLHFMGPGDYDLMKALPPGTDTFQLETAPSGHSVLPCCEYTPSSSSSDFTLTLISRTNQQQEVSPRPPPPSSPPVLPSTTSRAEVLSPPPLHDASSTQ